MPLFFGHSQNSNPDIETVLFFSIDKAMDALFAQSLFSKKPEIEATVQNLLNWCITF